MARRRRKHVEYRIQLRFDAHRMLPGLGSHEQRAGDKHNVVVGSRRNRVVHSFRYGAGRAGAGTVPLELPRQQLRLRGPRMAGAGWPPPPPGRAG